MLQVVPLADPQGLVGLAAKAWLNDNQDVGAKCPDLLDNIQKLVLELGPCDWWYFKHHQVGF